MAPISKTNSAEQHPFLHRWDFLLDDGGWSEDGSNMKKLCSVATIEEFWPYMNSMQMSMLKICQQENPLFSLRMFRSDIKPVWEDSHNKYGGKWVIPCTDMSAQDILAKYTEVVMNLVGESFCRKGAACGVILAFRKNGRKEIHIWVDTVPADKEQEGAFLKSLLRLDGFINFRPHDWNIAKVDTFRPRSGSILSDVSEEAAPSSPQFSQSTLAAKTCITLAPKTVSLTPHTIRILAAPQPAAKFSLSPQTSRSNSPTRISLSPQTSRSNSPSRPTAISRISLKPQTCR